MLLENKTRNPTGCDGQPRHSSLLLMYTLDENLKHQMHIPFFISI